MMPAVLGIGVSPSRLHFDMVRGSGQEATVLLSGLGEGPVEYGVSGSASGWVEVPVHSGYQPAADSQSLRLAVNVPPDASNNLYHALVVFRSAGPGGDGARNHLSLVPGVKLNISISVTGEQRHSYSIESVRIPDTDTGNPITVEYLLTNTGNVGVLPPPFSISIYDGSEMVGQHTAAQQGIVPPGTSAVRHLHIDHSLEPGAYLLLVQARDDNTVLNETLGLRVHDEGFLQSSGRLILIESPLPSAIGSVIRLAAWFENTGPVPVDARLVAELYEDGRLLETISSSILRISPGGADPLVAYFEPARPGKYEVRGYVEYNGRRAGPAQTGFTVFDEPGLITVPSAVFIVMLVLVVILCWRRYSLHSS